MENTSLWVFGYGSLCWNPGFEFDQTLTGHVKGYSRKFWQGNTTHRGVEGKPGRVATIIEDSRDVVWGRAFRLVGEAALRYLEKRECLLGGYKTIIGNFHPRHDVPGLTSFPVLIYVATPDNHLWLGDASIADIANQIVDCRGASGHNVEYLLKLARFMREHIPEADDKHLFTLEFLILSKIKEQNLSLNYLMGETPLHDRPPLEKQERPYDLDNRIQFTTLVEHTKMLHV
ncbi:hypothetical protein LSTR_LSTR014339 [Laodelphax striatellus]|uniref:glutathione-specific gamma-glutamylcyclotransferase n=1 Tax=Laodelphax striatellus TaxID=195883 RepID=A0A482WH05_LAOST|nr:hypothetical protein LSTR_LSTR014339 [Laodelphax striatellus]